MASRIQTVYDFTANTQDAEASVKRLAEGVKAGNGVLAAAEKQAKETYQNQSLSAKAAGASAEVLTKIQQQYFQSLVAIRAAAKELGTTLVESNSSSTTSENAKTEAVRLATAAIEQQTAAVKANAAAQAQASSHSISKQSAASGAVQFIEGRAGIRTVENFLGNSLGLGGLFSTLFPIIGAVQVGKLLMEMGEHVYEVGEKAHEAGAKLEEAMEAAHNKSQLVVADLTIQADKLQDNIDKLSGHPSNGLKTALDEARKSSMEFNSSLIENRKQVLELFKQYSVGVAGGWLAGKTPTSATEKSVDAQLKRMNAESAQIDSDINARIAKASSLSQRDALEKERQTRQNGLTGTYVGEWRKERQNAVLDNTTTDVDAKTGRVSYKQTDRNSGRIGDLDTAIGLTQSTMDEYNARMKVADLTKQELALKGQKEADELAKQGTRKGEEAARKAQEAATKAAAAQREQWDEDHTAWEAAGQRSTADEINFWVDRANQAKIGSENYNEASKKANLEIKKANDERRKLFDENLKMSMEFSAIAHKGIMAAVMPGFTANAKGVADAYTSGKALEDSQRQGAYAVAQANIALAAQRGQISANDAAIQTAALHQMQYEEKLAILKEKLAAVQLGPDSDAQKNGINKQISDLTNTQVMQQMQDVAQVASTSISGALRNVNDSWLADTKNTAKEVSDLYRGTVEGLNNDLTNTLMKVGERGQHHLGRDLGNAVGGTLRSGAGQLANYGLKTAESSLLGAFGMGGKPDGTRSNPWFVQMAGMSTLGANPFTGDLAAKLGFGGGKDSLNSGSSIFSSVLGLFGGGKAVGGPVNAGTTYLVGENGPELFNPGASGNITPNNKLSGMGTTYLHMPVDARGATNPAEVEAAANRAVSRAAPQIVAASLRAHSEQQNRMPSSKRS